MKPLSEKIKNIAGSATMEIANTAKKMQMEGIDVISLSLGEPDFATPEHITNACIEALNRGETHYTASNGIPELLSAISQKVNRENNFSLGPDEVIVTAGAKDAIYETMEAVLNPTDEVIILDPSWVSYEPCVRLAGAKVSHYSLKEPGFQIDDGIIEQVNSKTKMVVINSPSNPSGSILSHDSLNLVKDICIDNDLYALSDEIYEKLVYETSHTSLASLEGMIDRTITINGFSKAYAMTGWRLGYALANEKIIREMSKVQQHTISHPTTFAMWGGVAALNGPQNCVGLMREEFDCRRRFVISKLLDMGYTTAPANGAFYAYIKTPGDDLDIARKWLNNAHVAVTPGSAFGHPGWQRLSYAASMEKLTIAMERIERITE